jgi:hypothetical protein
VFNKEESYEVYKSDSCYYIIICKEAAYKFRIQAFLLKKKSVIIIILSAYSYSSATYYKNKQLFSL